MFILLLSSVGMYCLYYSQWINKWIFVSYRILATIYAIIWLIAYVMNRSVTKERGGKTFIFLSTWTYITFTITLTLITMTSCKYYIGECWSRRNHKSYSPSTNTSNLMDYMVKISWLLYTIMITTTFIITIGYYTTVDPDFDDFDVYALHIHGINLIIVIVDLVMARIPVMLLHFYAPMVYSLVYLVFTGVYTASGGTDHKGRDYIYAPLDYQNELGSSIGWAILLILLTLIVHCIFAVILLVRDYVAMRYNRCWYECAVWQVREIQMESTSNPSGQQVSAFINSPTSSSHNGSEVTSL